MSALIFAFQSLIPKNFLLQKNGSYWVVLEPGAANNKFEISGGLSQAFSLEGRGAVFPFFAHGLKGVQSVNDAIVLAVVDGEPYVVAVEMKSSANKVPDALKQIESGRRFVAWARGLLSLHGHWPGGQCKFFGVVSLTPRRQVSKGATRRSAELPAPDLHGFGFQYFVLGNHPRVSIADLVKKINSKFGQCAGVA